MVNQVTEDRASAIDNIRSLPEAAAARVRMNYLGQPLVDFGSDEVKGTSLPFLFDFPKNPVAMTPTGAGRLMYKCAEESLFRAIQSGELQPYAINPDATDTDDITGMAYSQAKAVLKDWFFVNARRGAFLRSGAGGGYA